MLVTLHCVITDHAISIKVYYDHKKRSHHIKNWSFSLLTKKPLALSTCDIPRLCSVSYRLPALKNNPTLAVGEVLSTDATFRPLLKVVT